MNVISEFGSAVKGWLIKKPCDGCQVAEQECWDRFRCNDYEVWLKGKPEIKKASKKGGL